MSAKTQTQEKLLGMVQRQAMDVLALPMAEREARYLIIRDSFRLTGKEFGQTDEQAAAWGSQVEKWVRALVQIIEQSGGAPGGSA